MFKNIIPLLLLAGAGVGAWFYYKRVAGASSSSSNAPQNNTGGITGGTRTGDSITDGVPSDTSTDYNIPSATQPNTGNALYSPLGQPLQGASTVTSQQNTTNSEIKSVLDPGNLLPALL